MGHSAIRRHHLERIKRKVRKMLRRWLPEQANDEITDKEVGVLANTRCPCSRECCGNPRRHFGKLTRQEIRAGEPVTLYNYVIDDDGNIVPAL